METICVSSLVVANGNAPDACARYDERSCETFTEQTNTNKLHGRPMLLFRSFRSSRHRSEPRGDRFWDVTRIERVRETKEKFIQNTETVVVTKFSSSYRGNGCESGQTETRTKKRSVLSVDRVSKNERIVQNAWQTHRHCRILYPHFGARSWRGNELSTIVYP